MVTQPTRIRRTATPIPRRPTATTTTRPPRIMNRRQARRIITPAHRITTNPAPITTPQATPQAMPGTTTPRHIRITGGVVGGIGGARATIINHGPKSNDFGRSVERHLHYIARLLLVL